MPGRGTALRAQGAGCKPFARPVPRPAGSAHRRCTEAHALPFGFGRPKQVIDDEKSEMWKAQQEILNSRKQGKSLQGVTERRAEAKRKTAEREQKRRRDRARLSRGEALDNTDDERPIYKSEDEGFGGGIIIPLAPFGIPKYDNGERFDLKAPYTDEGWVDSNDQGPFARLAEIFSGGKYGKQKPAPKQQPQQKRGKAQRGGGKQKPAAQPAKAQKQGFKLPWQR